MISRQEALQNWQKNGMDEIVCHIAQGSFYAGRNPASLNFEEKTECRNFSEKTANILYNLGFEDFFRKEQISKRDIHTFSGRNTYLTLINLYDKELTARCLKYSKAYGKLQQKYHFDDSYRDLAGEILPGVSKCADFLCPEKPEMLFENALSTLNKFANRGDDAEEISSLMGNVFSVDYENGRNFKAMQLKYLQEMLRRNINTDLLKVLNSAFYTIYSDRPQRLSETTYPGLLQNVLSEAISNPNSLFCKQTNMYGTQNHTYGIGDYTYQAYTSRVTPENLHELKTIAKELPATDFDIFQSNRQDGIALSRTYGGLRDLIHDEIRGVNEVIDQMVAFYDSHGNAPTDKIIKALGKSNAALELQSYDKVITYKNREKKEISESNIAILRRLQKNMQQSRGKCPKVQDETQPLIDEIENSKYVPGEALQKLLTGFNQKIENKMARREIGIAPQEIDFINWADKKAQQYLNDMSFEEQCGFYKTPLCYEILKFNELTNSPATEFSAAEFDHFYLTQVFHAPTMRQAYQNIAGRQNRNMFGLMEKYGKIAEKNRLQAKLIFSDPNVSYSEDFKSSSFDDIEQQKRERIAGIASGNCMKALQNLTQYKEASSDIGARYRKELEATDPLRRDFDILLTDMNKKGIDLSVRFRGRERN